jgi:hypothetical protein
MRKNVATMKITEIKTESSIFLFEIILVKNGASETPILLAANRIVAISSLPLLKILLPEETRSGNKPENPNPAINIVIKISKVESKYRANIVEITAMIVRPSII